MKLENQSHTFPPFYEADSRLLILGSFPSRKSREVQFYYGHPQNRFWRVLSAVYQDKVPENIEEKKQFLKRNHIALYDVIESCRIRGSDDASIEKVTPADLSSILKNSQIKRIVLNGNKAKEYFLRYQNIPDMDILFLPSTSAANANWSLEKLTEKWKEIIN